MDQRQMLRDSVYPRLTQEMERKGMSAHALSRRMDVDCHTLYSKLRGRVGWKLWEAIAIKKALQTDAPIEELFKKA